MMIQEPNVRHLAAALKGCLDRANVPPVVFATGLLSR
jgi:hypothetical protein